MSQPETQSPAAVILRMEGDVASLAPNAVIKLRWTKDGIQKIRSLRRGWVLRALDAWHRANSPVFVEKVRISYVVYRGRVLDERNLGASEAFKVIEDALIGRAYRDDSPRYVESGPVEQVTGKQHRECPTLLMRIEAVGE